MVVVFFGGLGTYYFQVFQWRHLEDPKYDLLIVKKEDSGELAFFRKKTNPDFVDPARVQLNRLIALRKASKKGTVVPDGNEQTVKEIGNKLIEIMDGAKLRQIPKVYEKKYTEILVGISEIYRGWLAYQEAMDSEIPEEKTRYINESIKWTKSADKRLKIGRDFFFVN